MEPRRVDWPGMKLHPWLHAKLRKPILGYPNFGNAILLDSIKKWERVPKFRWHNYNVKLLCSKSTQYQIWYWNTLSCRLTASLALLEWMWNVFLSRCKQVWGAVFGSFLGKWQNTECQWGVSIKFFLLKTSVNTISMWIVNMIVGGRYSLKVNKMNFQTFQNVFVIIWIDI